MNGLEFVGGLFLIIAIVGIFVMGGIFLSSVWVEEKEIRNCDVFIGCDKFKCVAEKTNRINLATLNEERYQSCLLEESLMMGR